MNDTVGLMVVAFVAAFIITGGLSAVAYLIWERWKGRGHD